ncbi:hypothetical protein [Enterobacter sp. Bisph1]|uniref:hypothetical protein n=1 Tax=Enterobacter sp. Bisph1 TaxID=1274399 RepID=UPI00057C0CEE|nr:hypothetical protein [Enterobacter sp. Bisph1]
MTTIFIAGSITIKKLDPLVMERLKKIVDNNYPVVVGDANGVDSSVQQALQQMQCNSATIFSSSPKPRNNIGGWPVQVVKTDFRRGTRDFYTAKDLQMAETADCGLMIWDSKSTGTLSNVIELLMRKKNAVVFINQKREFVIVKTAEDVEKLVNFMSQADYAKADEKIKLSEKIDTLKNQQIAMFTAS